MNDSRSLLNNGLTIDYCNYDRQNYKPNTITSVQNEIRTQVTTTQPTDLATATGTEGTRYDCRYNQMTFHHCSWYLPGKSDNTTGNELDNRLTSITELVEPNMSQAITKEPTYP